MQTRHKDYLLIMMLHANPEIGLGIQGHSCCKCTVSAMLMHELEGVHVQQRTLGTARTANLKTSEPFMKMLRKVLLAEAWPLLKALLPSPEKGAWYKTQKGEAAAIWEAARSCWGIDLIQVRSKSDN